MYHLLKFSKELPLAVITINRPEARNSLSNPLVDELARCLQYGGLLGVRS